MLTLIVLSLLALLALAIMLPDIRSALRKARRPDDRRGK